MRLSTRCASGWIRLAGWIITFSATAAGLAAPAAADEDGHVAIAFDCSLDSGPISCAVLEAAYFRAFADVAVPGPGGVTVAVRTVPMPRGTRYEVRTSGAAGGGALSAVVRDVLDEGETLGRVLALAQRASLLVLVGDGAVETENGRLSVPWGRSTADPPRAESDTRWYVRPSLGLEAWKQGASVVSAEAELEASVSAEAYRALLSGRGYYRRLSLDVPGGDRLEGDVLSGELELLMARSLGEHVSVATFGRTARAPANNLDASFAVGIGVEWLDVPLRRHHENVAGLRYRAEVLHDDFTTRTALRDDETYAYVRHSLAALARIHVGDVDFMFEARGTQALPTAHAWELVASAEATVGLAAGLDISIGGRLTYRHAALRAPRDSDQLDPIAVVIEGTSFARLGYEGAIQLSYALGDTLASAEDQRWKP